LTNNSIIIICCFFIIILAYANPIVTYTISSPNEQQSQQRPDGEPEENEPNTDLPIIDSPCKSWCPPNYELCPFICDMWVKITKRLFLS
jgi:hypothetical protein